MYIDGDTHYWPLRFIDKVKHPGKGHLEVVEDKGDMVRYGEVVPGKVATYYRDGKKIHSFKEGRWSIPLRAEFMKKDGFDIQVLIPDNRPLIYECDPELGRQLARAYNDTVAEDIQGDDRFIGVAWIYLPDIKESVKELRRAVKELGLKAVNWTTRCYFPYTKRSPISKFRFCFIPPPVCLSCSTAIPGLSAPNGSRDFSIFPQRSAFR
jgi:predicted TIM-barrel fold metal-dependent hydrolase